MLNEFFEPSFSLMAPCNAGVPSRSHESSASGMRHLPNQISYLEVFKDQSKIALKLQANDRKMRIVVEINESMHAP
jgi:hypothetical protein